MLQGGINVLCATLLVLRFEHSSAEINHLINWQIFNPPIVFGRDVVLFCNASLAENCCTNTATWMRGFDVIVHHGASTNYSKYIEEKQSNGFLLIIKNFDEYDINQQYTCLYDFSSYSAVIRIDLHNFKYIPNKDEFKANINKTSDFEFFADVSFLKVYPLPDCILVANQEKINTNVTVEEEAKIGHFYQIKLHLVCEIHPTECMESVAVLCRIGKDEMVVQNRSISTCPDINDSLESDKNSSDHPILVVFIFSGLLLFSTLIIVFVLMWKKRKRSSRTIFSSLEGSVANSTRSERCCVRFWETRDCYGEESEKIPLLGSNSDILNNDRCYDTYEEDQTNGVRCLMSFPQAGDSHTTLSMCVLAFTSREWTIIPAQKDEDVTGIVYHGTGQDQSDIQRLITNFKINIAFLWKSVRRLKAFRYSPNMPIEEGQVYGPAQKEKDVINMVNYAKIFDKDYAEKLASDELINSARLKKTIPRLKPQPSFYVAGPRGTNVSDVDVLKGSSWIPTWGIRKRSRIRKQKPSNE